MSMRWPLFFAGSLGYRLALGWLGLVVVAGLVGPWLPLPYPPATPDLLSVAAPPAWAGPGPLHYLGTDPTGRDVLAELVFGTRQLLLLSLPASAIATLLGALAGGAAGFWGNRGLVLPWAVGPLVVAVAWGLLVLPYRLPVVGGLVMVSLVLLAHRRWLRRQGRLGSAKGTFPFPLDSLLVGATTLLGAVPRLVLVVALAAGPPLGGGQLLAVLALIAWPDAARLVRAQMLRVRVLPFVEAARAAGLPGWRIWWRHALPHACQPLWTFAPLSIAGLIALESTLAFLGIGLLPTTPSWGRLLGTLHQEPAAWWLAAGPGLALLFTLLALQSLAHRLSSQSHNEVMRDGQHPNVTFEALVGK